MEMARPLLAKLPSLQRAAHRSRSCRRAESWPSLCCLRSFSCPHPRSHHFKALPLHRRMLRGSPTSTTRKVSGGRRIRWRRSRQTCLQSRYRLKEKRLRRKSQRTWRSRCSASALFA
eukprot:IDg11855t1